MATQRIQLYDLLVGVVPYEPHLLRTPMRTEDLMPELLASAAAKTAKDILRRSGAPDMEITEADVVDAHTMFSGYMAGNSNAITTTKLQKPETVIKLEALVAEYDWRVIQHADQIRMLVTNKLLGLSDHKDPKVQLKAVELLGKLADVGMFVEKQEITYKQKSEEELQNSLMQKLGLLIEGEIIEDNPSPKPTSTLAKTSTTPVIVRETVPLPVLPTINFTDIINLP
jgi:hypothetical protein